MAWGVSAAFLGTTVYWVLLHFKPSALPAAILLTAATVVLVGPCWAITAYINERFHTGMRASGFGLGYSLAVVIPSFYAFYQGLVGEVMNPTYTVLPLLVHRRPAHHARRRARSRRRATWTWARSPVRRPRTSPSRASRASPPRRRRVTATGVAMSREERIR